MGRITYADKVALNSNAGIPAQNKVNDVDMNNVKNAINQLGAYLSATVQTGQPGKSYITAPGTLASGDTFNVMLPTAVNPSANAQFSVDGGTTYYNIISKNNHNLKANMIANQAHTLYFNGTNFICLEDIVMYSTVTFYKGGTDQVFSSDTYNNVITWSNISGNTGIEDLIYLENGVITISNKVEKIDIIGDIWMTQVQPNFQWDFNGATTFIILYNQAQNRYFINNNYAIDKTKAKNTLKISPYISGTVYGDNMWTWLNITLTYRY